LPTSRDNAGIARFEQDGASMVVVVVAGAGTDARVRRVGTRLELMNYLPADRMTNFTELADTGHADAGRGH
jgi:hypothetical protein